MIETYTDWTLDGGKVIRIPNSFIEKNSHLLDISEVEAAKLYLADQGLIINPEQEELNMKAKSAGTSFKATGAKSQHKAPVRKPDIMKRALIEEFRVFLEKLTFTAADTATFPEDVEVTNIEREISFIIEGESYTITLIKKRPPKN